MGYSTPATVGTGPTAITDTMWNELVNDLIDLRGDLSGAVLNADSVTLTNGMVCSLNSSGNLLRSTSAGQSGPLVVVQEQLVSGTSTGIAAGATGFYAAAGRVTVKITGTVAKGDFLQASATAATAQTGTANPFAVAVTAGSGGFCQAILFQQLLGAGTGTVTSVAATVPAEFSLAGSPITSSGTLAITKATQTANQVYAGPTSGAAAAPTFRALGADDLGTAWTTWTPTLTQGAAVTLTVNYARYCIVGKVAHVGASLTLTGGGTAGNQFILAGIPGAIAPTRTGSHVPAGTFVYKAAANYYQGALMTVGTNDVRFVIQAPGALVYFGNVTAITLANGDQLNFIGSWELT